MTIYLKGEADSTIKIYNNCHFDDEKKMEILNYTFGGVSHRTFGGATHSPTFGGATHSPTFGGATHRTFGGATHSPTFGGVSH